MAPCRATSHTRTRTAARSAVVLVTGAPLSERQDAAVIRALDARIVRMRNEVRDLRTASKLSQQQLAEAMEVSRQTINSIEKERYTPSLPLAMALARYFGKTVEEVFHADT